MLLISFQTARQIEPMTFQFEVASSGPTLVALDAAALAQLSVSFVSREICEIQKKSVGSTGSSSEPSR